jgi:hypothetical protein
MSAGSQSVVESAIPFERALKSRPRLTDGVQANNWRIVREIAKF